MARLITLLLVLAGCAATLDKSQSWVDRDLKEVAAVWGNPTKTVSLQDGNTLYFFPKRRGLIDFADPMPRLIDVDSRGIIYFKNEPVYLLRGDSPTIRCNYDTFVIGPDNKVVTWRSFGC